VHAIWIAVGAALVGAAALGFALMGRGAGETHAEVCAALQQQRLTRIYADKSVSINCPGVSVTALSAVLRQQLAGKDSLALRASLSREKGAAIALSSASSAHHTLADKLGAFAQLPGVRAVVLTPRFAVYAPRRDAELSLHERDALAYVARALLRGAREPSLNSFPPNLRRVERVEVMVMLREHGEPRLWRSARGTSLARALLTATRVARDRWHEREAAMGGSLGKRLLDMDVEVSLLSEEGSLLGGEPAFIDRATPAEFGIGFEYGASWHYVLPEDMQRRGKGSAQRALLGLLSEQSLPSSVIAQTAFRAYRFVALILGVSKAPLGAGASPG
jgi:hypothetical protein